MLYEFLIQHKDEIIQLCRDKVLAASESKPTSELLERGLPVFYNKLINKLRRVEATGTDFTDTFSESESREGDEAVHGKESLRLGYTISQVVYAYGAVCQSITEFVQAQSYKITAQAFQSLNLSLDTAIAEAVTEFRNTESKSANDAEIERLGFLVHELGNSLAAASIAFCMIQEGKVGSTGATGDVLSSAFERMRYVISNSLAEVRMRRHAHVERIPMLLVDILSEVEAAANIMGKSKGIRLMVESVDPKIQLTADRHLIFSALSNLVSNAVKFTKGHGTVSLRGKASRGRILIEVEDECGGLPEGKKEELFKSFVQEGTDKTGMGLGLSISHRAIELNQGKLSVRNIPGKGCVFTIDLPQDE